MKASTVEVLDRINRDFYRERASEFSRTRKRPWTGWRKLFGLADSSLRSPRVSILDLGCGNGRLLPELVRAFGTEISYLGLDRSVPLVGEARRTLEGSLTARAHLAAADLLREPLAELALHARFDLILAFGLLHHVPSLERRRQLLSSAARRLRPGGLLGLSFWQFGELQRFRSRFESWDTQPACAGLDTGDLEPGDHLLGWGDAGAVRYCHHAGPAEAAELVGSVGLRKVESFLADGESGRLNLYHLLRRPA